MPYCPIAECPIALPGQVLDADWHELCAVQKILSDAQNTTTFAWKKYMGAHDVVLVSGPPSFLRNLVQRHAVSCTCQDPHACTKFGGAAHHLSSTQLRQAR